MSSSAPNPENSSDNYPRQYFETGNYSDRSLGRFSMYWFARRYYAALVRRHAPTARGGSQRTLLELGVGLGDLLSLLQDDFDCTGLDISEFSVENARVVAPRAVVEVGNADLLEKMATGTFYVVVSLHVVEHLDDPERVIGEVYRLLRPGGLFVFATPNPAYALRRLKDPASDAIGKDPTHVNVHPPAQWRRWCERAGFRVEKHFGDGLWDVPYIRIVPQKVQFGIFGLPALAQVISRTAWTPVSMGVNQILVCRR